MPHAAGGHFGQRGLCGVQNYETIDVELTWCSTTLVRRERRTTTVCLAPATVRVLPCVVGSELGTTMLVHDAV